VLTGRTRVATRRVYLAREADKLDRECQPETIEYFHDNSFALVSSGGKSCLFSNGTQFNTEALRSQ